MRTCFVVVFLCFFGIVSAQTFESRIHYEVVLGDTSQLHQLILLDYTKMLGVAQKVARDSIYFRLRSAPEASAIPLNELRYLGVFTASDSPEGREKYFQAVPSFTDLTYERTALPLRGKGQLRVINLIYGVMEWNLNDHIQLGAGIAGPLGVLFTQKLRTSITPQFHVGVTGQQLWTPLINTFDNSQILLGDIAGIITLGDEKRFMNLGAGILFNTDAFEDESPITAYRFGIGGQVGKKWHVYSELLMTIPNENNQFGGLSLFPSLNASYGSRRHRWQFGVFTVFLDEDSFFPPPLPYVGYAYYW